MRERDDFEDDVALVIFPEEVAEVVFTDTGAECDDADKVVLFLGERARANEDMFPETSVVSMKRVDTGVFAG